MLHTGVAVEVALCGLHVHGGANAYGSGFWNQRSRRQPAGGGDQGSQARWRQHGHGLCTASADAFCGQFRVGAPGLTPLTPHGTMWQGSSFNTASGVF